MLGHTIGLDLSDIRPPFPVKRVYMLYGATAHRGGHAHRELRQLAHCPAGACTFILDDGEDRVRVRLDRPEKGLLLGPGMWREMVDFTPDCRLVVFASEPYDPADYILDYEEFTHSCAPASS